MPQAAPKGVSAANQISQMDTTDHSGKREEKQPKVGPQSEAPRGWRKSTEEYSPAGPIAERVGDAFSQSRASSLVSPINPARL